MEGYTTMKRILAVLLSVSVLSSLAGCGCQRENPEPQPPGTPAGTEFSVGMVTDIGGVNDQSFNQSAWEGLNRAKEAFGCRIGYLESKQEADYGPNLDKMADEEYDLVWGIGFMMADAIENAARQNPAGMYAIVDNAYAETPDNVISVVFRAQEPSFLVGYIAGRMTQTGKVGFIGGMKSGTIDQFDYGFQGGVQWAAKELGKDITVEVQYAESFSDTAKGKSIAQKMISGGCDIVFHAAGNAGNGVIEAAKEAGKYAIGVDRDQSYLAPDTVITSAMKLVGDAMYLVTERVKNGESLGGQTLAFGIKEKCAGISSASDKLVPADILEATGRIEQMIVNEEIVPPYDEETYRAYLETLQ